MNTDKCAALERLGEIVRRLSGPDGCPWDKVQTPETLADYVIEESHELVAAIRSGNSRDICGELGDVLFLLLFIAHCYERQGEFSLADALDGSGDKMMRRHPHVFGGAPAASREEHLKNWEAIKKTEEGNKNRGLFASLPASLPPLIKAYRIHSKAARAGFTWPTDEEAEQQVESEWLEWLDVARGDDAAAQKHELGDMLFSLVEVGRRKGIKASEALDLAAMRFLRRFARMEEMAGGSGLDGMSLEEMDELWNRAKAAESPASQEGE